MSLSIPIHLWVALVMCRVDCCVQETSAKLAEAVQKMEEMSTDLQFIGEQLHKLNAFMEVSRLLVFLLHGVIAPA